MKNHSIKYALLALITLNLVACNEEIPTGVVRKISFALTNDIHGHLDAEKKADGTEIGGMAYYAKVIQDLRKKPEYAQGQAGLVLLDSGDQFQGTLLSNYDEGKTIFSAMNEIGYDAIIAGNHDYDFGPMGWLYDKVVPGKTSNDPREVIKKLSTMAQFPIISANTYFKKSIRAFGSNSATPVDAQCKALDQTSAPLDFLGAARPTFLKPYTIVKKAGVRIALIGIDHHNTASMTTIENVSDLCFRDEVESYLEVRNSLEKQADIFVMVMHNGNMGNSKEASEITEKINKIYPNGVNLVAAGHTHVVHDDLVGKVHVVQNGANGLKFGLVNLYWDEEKKKVLTDLTQSSAGIELKHAANEAEPTVQEIVNRAKIEIAPMTSKILATAKERVRINRTDENALGNLLTDALRAASGTQIAFMNAGGIRTDLKPGVITYQDFFEVLPFNNLAVTMKAVPWKTLKKLLAYNAQTCGNFGALNQSGLKIQFRRNCEGTNQNTLDANATVVKVELDNGEVLFDADTAIEVAAEKTFSVATVDFIAAGGSGFVQFKGETISETNGIARELIAQELSRTQPVLTNSIDQRTRVVK